MKQHITIEQLEELSEKGRQELAIWMIKNDGVNDHPLSIGLMIEFLDQRWEWLHIRKIKNTAPNKIFYKYWSISNSSHSLRISSYSDLCDALWQATKEVLDK